MKVLITGIAGFIGSHVAELCLKMGMTVYGIDDLSGGSRENVPEGVTFLHGSASTQARYLRQSGHVFDAIYHLAAYAAEGLSHFIRHYNYTNNLLETVDLVNEAVKGLLKDGGRFVFTSSIAVYGHMPEDVWYAHEVLRPHPCDPYGVSKLACEMDLAAAAEMWPGKFNYTIFRPHNVVGIRQNLADNYRNVVGIHLRQALTGEPLRIFGDGKQTRQFSDVSDVAPYIAVCPTLPNTVNQTYNIGGDTPYTVLDVADAVRRAVCAQGIDVRLQFEEARKEVVHIACDHTKLKRDFGITKEPVTLSESVAKMAEWAKDRVIEQPKPFTGIEVHEGMPPSWAKFGAVSSEKADTKEAGRLANEKTRLEITTISHLYHIPLAEASRLTPSERETMLTCAELS